MSAAVCFSKGPTPSQSGSSWPRLDEQSIGPVGAAVGQTTHSASVDGSTSGPVAVVGSTSGVCLGTPERCVWMIQAFASASSRKSGMMRWRPFGFVISTLIWPSFCRISP